MKLLSGIAALLVATIALLWLLRLHDSRAENAEWARLQALQPEAPERFSHDMLEGLPTPAQRYFMFAIAPGTPLWPVAEIEMRGEFALGNKEAPGYQPMQARQILAAPHGFLWAMHTEGGMPLSGSDSASWTRFRLLGLIPVARLGGDPDHRRSAFGRYVAEAVFWTPAALLPGPGISWDPVDDQTARVTIRHSELSQSVDVTIGADGRPTMVTFQRWSNANADKVHRLQPFGGYLSDFREVSGYRLPFRVEAGNLFATEDYFPFFKADITSIRFPTASTDAPESESLR